MKSLAAGVRFRTLFLRSLAIFIFFLLLVVILTWPVAINLNRMIFGYEGDSTGTIYDIWFRRQNGLNFVGTGQITQRGAPFGYEMNYWPILSTFIPTFVSYCLSFLLPAVVVYNLMILLAGSLTGLSMYISCRLLHISRGPSLWAGVAFVFFPFSQLALGGWISQAQLGFVPLAIALVIRLVEEQRTVWLVLALAIVGVSGLTNAYVFLICTSIIAVGVFLLTISRKTASNRSWVITVSVVGLFIAIGFLYALLNAANLSFSRPPEEVKAYGLRVRELILPNELNRVSLLGIRHDAGSNNHGSNVVEQSHFVGFFTLVLTSIGLYCVLRDQKSRVRGIALVVIGLSMYWIAASQGISLLGLDIPRPAGFFTNVAPFWRVFSRFGVAIMAVCVIAAAVGLERLTGKLRMSKKALVLGLCALLSMVELWSPLPGRVTSITRTKLFSQVNSSEMNSAILANYPIQDDGTLVSYRQNVLQMSHSRPILNGGPPGSRARFAQGVVSNVHDRFLGDKLFSLGVTHVVLDLEAIQDPLVATSQLESQGFELLARDGSLELLRVPRQSLKAVAWYEGEIYAPEPRRDGSTWRWLQHQANIVYTVSESGCYRISGKNMPFNPANSLTVSHSEGLAKRESKFTGDFSLFVFAERGMGSLGIRSNVAPLQIPPPDNRLVTQYLSDPSIEMTRMEDCQE